MSITIDKMIGHGRELAVMFTCFRCNETTIKPFADVVRFEPKATRYANDVARLGDTQLPDDWTETHNSVILCKECAAAYEQFMKPPAKVRKEG